MRLSDVLSKPPNDLYKQVEGFLDGKKLRPGQQKKIKVGNVGLPFFCRTCEDDHTFCSQGDLCCIGVDNRSISIDCVLNCTRCELSSAASVPAWFLVTCDEEVFSRDPNVKILKRSFKLPQSVAFSDDRFEGFEEMLEKASLAHSEELGAGSVIYLRKILEKITQKVASIAGISPTKAVGKRKPFKEFLKEVDTANPFIPREFSANGYRLFGDLSDVIHGDSDEQLALQKYHALRRLVIGVIDNVKNNQEIMAAINALGWNGEGDAQ